MANGSTDTPDTSPTASGTDWVAVMGAFLSAITSNENASFDGIRGAVVASTTQAHGAKMSAVFKWLETIVGLIGKGVEDVESIAVPILAAFIAPMVAGMFGTDSDVSAFASRENSGGRQAAATALTGAFLSAVVGTAGGPIDPDDQPARHFAASGVQAALEGWFLSALPELVADFIPLDIGRFGVLAELPDEVLRTLGVGRLMHTALSPLVNATAATPLKWWANQQFRPTNLGISTVVRAYMRGNQDYSWLYDQLTRHGYRDEDIDELVNEQSKFLPIGDLVWLVWEGILDVDSATQTLRDQGYDEQTASKHLNVYGLRQVETIHRELATAAITAYVDRKIDDATLQSILDATVTSGQEKQAMVLVAQGRQQLKITPLSAAEAKACVEAGILPMSSYTTALTNAGYQPDDVDALELLLNLQISQKADAAALKAEAAKAKAAKAAATAATAAAKQAEVTAARALKRRGALGTLDDAYVRGLVDITRVEEVLAADFDPDTVAIYVSELESKRADYLAKQAKASAAATRAANKGLSVGQLQTALTDGILTAGQVQAELEGKGLAADDVAVLVETMQQKAAASQQTATLRAAAQQRAAHKVISLAEAEALTVAGHWTMDDFNSFLATLDYDAGEAALLDELVADKIAKAAAAGAAKAKTTAPASKGLSLAQSRAAVVAGLRTSADYGADLVAAGYTTAAVSTLVAEATAAAQAAEATRARRAAQPPAPTDGRPVALADVTRAARLGLLTPADYQTELVNRGYSPAAVALELELLQTEIAAAGGTGTTPGAATVAKAALKYTEVDGELARKGLSHADVENAVKAGLTSLDAYVTWLVNNGIGQSDAEILRALLAAKLTTAPAPAAAPPIAGTTPAGG